jgi:hypothetical protein
LNYGYAGSLKVQLQELGDTEKRGTVILTSTKMTVLAKKPSLIIEP